MPLFNTIDINRNFDERDRARGRAYQQQGRVRELRIENAGTRILAAVQGTESRPYDVHITVEKRKNHAVFHAECTCPVGYMCKHGAAALYETIAQWDRQREKLPSSRPYESVRATVPAGNIAPTQTQRLIYLINDGSSHKKPEVTVTPALQTLLKAGGWSKPRPQGFSQILAQNQFAPFLTEKDHAVFRLVNPVAGMNYYMADAVWHPPEDPELIDLFLRRAIDTGRAFASESAAAALRPGKDMDARPGWALLPDGRQKPVIEPARPGLVVLMSNSPWYIDPATHEAGPLRSGLPFDQLHDFLDTEPVTARKAEHLRAERAKSKTETPPPYIVAREAKAKPVAPVPRLHIQRDAGDSGNIARLTLKYGDAQVNPSDPSPHFHIVKGDRLFLHKRDKKAEAKILKRLTELRLEPAPDADRPNDGLYLKPAAGSPSWFWLDFAHEAVPALREAKYDIELDATADMAVTEADDDAIEASFAQNGEWWFSLDLGITVNGRRAALLPILVALLRDIHTAADIDRLTAHKKCYAPLPGGGFVALPSARVKTILETLVELFGPRPLDDKGRLRISFDLATALLKIKGFTKQRWLGEGKLKNLVEQLADFAGIASVPLPSGLGAELRPYQKEGYDWLHFLGSYNLGGVLADDMGLGKTVQALAYILSLKDRGLAAPCLIIMPTSLVTNWQTEIARFAPGLRALTLHGKDRAQNFAAIAGADVVLTTYPLVIRDIDNLRAHKWSLIILDEAQAIKNPTSKIMQSVCMLDGKQRLCLTGTPVENHLGEIWSIFAFLMPGLLGDHGSFMKLYRAPIEKYGDSERQNLLSRRLRPFILRRLKADVAAELPPKTEIIQRVTLADDQRDLYETVRHVMNDKVREQIADKGFARSQIVILDALLKLRQVCCDPRLVKIAAASKVKTSAKLAALLEILPTLIEDGRRILLFSQFTSMLDLIKPELDNAHISYVELRGTTKDRKTPIARFQKKEVPLFLISLKAGGTGLNLTAADTVIHFDPWWNPSVENQATDRAHRIGQDKPVFVYKFIAEGTIEERILELQAKKSHLASALFGESPAAAAALTPDDLKWLMEGVPR